MFSLGNSLNLENPNVLVSQKQRSETTQLALRERKQPARAQQRKLGVLAPLLFARPKRSGFQGSGNSPRRTRGVPNNHSKYITLTRN